MNGGVWRVGTALVGVVMGSESDRPRMAEAVSVLREFGIECNVAVASAHRAPGLVREWVQSAEAQGVQVFIAGAGMAAHLPGVVASLTARPVIGVPLSAGSLQGLDALYSVVQMPPGVPVATVAVDGAKNAAYLAAQILAVASPDIHQRYLEHKAKLESRARAAFAASQAGEEAAG